MNQYRARWREYESTSRPKSYKGFWKVNEVTYKLMGKTHLTFSNGKKLFFTSGDFREEAFEKMFDRIDQVNNGNPKVF